MTWDESKRDARLARWLDGEMTATEIEQLRRDAESDPDLATEMHQYRRIEALLEQLAQDRPGVDYDAQRRTIMTAVGKRTTARRRRGIGPVLATLATAAAILLAVGLYAHRTSSTPPASAPQRIATGRPTLAPDDNRIRTSLARPVDSTSGRVRVSGVRLDRPAPQQKAGPGTVVVSVGGQTPIRPAATAGAMNLMDLYFGG